MNKKHTLLIIFLTIIIIGSINTLNATETPENNTIIHNEDTTHTYITPHITNKTIKQAIKKEPLEKPTTENVSTYSEFIKAINNAKQSNTTNYTINLKKGNYTITNKIIWANNLENRKKLIINGQGSTITGNNTKSFIQVNSNNTLIIENMTITNTSKNYGSAIYNSGTTIIYSTIFKNNHATTKNTLGGGAIFNTGNLTINNSTFENNTSDFDGGAIYNIKNNMDNMGYIQINNSTFTNNNARTGAGIYNFNGKLILINNTTFKSNNANNSLIYIQDYSKENIINNSHILNNNCGDTLITNLENMTIENTTLSNNNVTNTLIYLTGNTVLYKIKITNNTSNNTIINTNTTTIIKQSGITNNNATNLIRNYDQLFINDTMITSNTLTNTGIINNNSLILTNNTFNNNTVIEKSLIYDKIGITKVHENKFYENKCNDLFIGTEKTFSQVINNIYKGNNLRYTDITINNKKIYNYDENVTINGQVNTDKIYNTTVNTGKISLMYNDEILDTADVINGSYTINKYLNKTGMLNLTLIYEGQNDYIDTADNVNISIEIPHYILQIITENESYSYGEPITYTVYLTNTGKGNGSNITIKNILDKNLEYMNSTDDNFSITTNTWYIDRLNSNETKNITITTTSNKKDDINITITTNSPINETSTATKIIRYVEPDYNLTVNSSDMYLFGSRIVNQIIINNTGAGRGNNISLIFSLSKNDKEIMHEVIPLNKIEPHDIIIVNKRYTSLTYGNLTGKIILNDLLNNTCVYNFKYIVPKPYITLDKKTAHPGDTINISATLHNINTTVNGKFVFKLNNKTLRNYTINQYNNTITVLNYKISDGLKGNNVLEVKYNVRGLDYVLCNKTSLNLHKFKVTSILDNIKGYPGDYVNLTVHLKDNQNNNVTRGKVVFKINDKTIKDKRGNVIYINVTNGIVQLTNFQIPLNFGKDKYKISVVYGSNNKYEYNRNYSSLNIIHQQTRIIITNTTFKPGNKFTIHCQLKAMKTNKAIYGGNIVFKVNGKTISPKIQVNNNTLSFTYYPKNAKFIKNIIVCFSGNTIYHSTRETLSFVPST